MGANTWMLVLADTNARDALSTTPALDEVATRKLAVTLFPNADLDSAGRGDLSFTCPPKKEVHLGCFPGVSVVAAMDFALDRPSTLDPRFLDVGGSGNATLHAMHSTVDWFAYAVWEGGELRRALSLSPDSGIMEDIGQRFPFEEPYWSGAHPVGGGGAPYPLPFHPLELGEAALRDRFGYQLEGQIDASMIEPWSIPLVSYGLSRSPWWKFW